jgi:polysaccharide biosynthesis transport protein
MSVSVLQPEETPAAAAPLDLVDVTLAVLHRWKLIVAVPACLLMVTYAGLKVVPVRYQSGAQLLIFDPQREMEDSSGRQQSVRDFDTVAINTEIEIMKSAGLSLRVARELRLDKYPEFQQHSRVALALDRWGWIAAGLRDLLKGFEPGNLGQSTGRHPAADSTVASAKQVEAAAAILRGQLRVDRVPLSYVLAVSATARSPELAQRVVAKVVDDYLAGQREMRQTALQQRALWLKEQLSELKSRIADTETTIEKLKAQSGMSDTGKGSVREQQIADLNTQLMLVQGDVVGTLARLEQARQLSHGSGTLQDMPDVEASSLGDQLRLEQSELIHREIELRAKLGDRHPAVLAIKEQLAGINKALDDEAARTLGNLNESYQIALRREQALKESLRRLTATQVDSGDYIKLQQLERVAAADSKLYETYISEYDEIGTRESLQVSDARIISPATLPTEPSYPRSKLAYLSVGSVGIVMGVFSALFAEFLQPRVRTGAAAERTFGYPVVGALPRVQLSRSAGDQSLAQMVISAPMSPFSEAVRTIRLGLRLSQLGQESRVILVTSCLPGEGKSTLALLLAIASAGAHQRTVLVDCDLRGRTISRKYGERRPGLSEILTGLTNLDTAIIHDTVTGCYVIPAGSCIGSPGDLLASPRMGEIIKSLRELYDYVVLDTPPLLSVIDALTLAALVDNILIVVDGTSSSCHSINQGLRLLRPENERISGMIFNKVDADQLRHYGYSGYRHQDMMQNEL